MNANDRQEGGDHYRKLDVQPWDALKAWLTRTYACVALNEGGNGLVLITEPITRELEHLPDS